MSQRLVTLNDVLEVLTETGPLSSDALARRLRLSRLDARLVLVDAHAHGLVRTTARGQWELSVRGREALAMELHPDRRAVSEPRRRWSTASYLQGLRPSGGASRLLGALNPRHFARRGLPLALGAIVCAGGVAVASSRLESSPPPPVAATTHAKPAKHVRHAHRRSAQHAVLLGTATIHHRRRSTRVAATPFVHHLGGHLLIRQNHRRPPTACSQRHSRHTRLVGSCARGRGGTIRSAGRGSRTSPGRRATHDTGATGSGGKSATSPPAASAGH
jgi:hypothetical protein